MKNIFFLFSLCLGLSIIACKNSTPTPSETTTIAKPEVPVVATPAPLPIDTATTCYLMTLKRDTTAIQLTIHGDDVVGYYAWVPYGTDSARGSLKGKKKGNIIHADFEYMIEGSIQSEGIVLKLENGMLYKGFAPLHEVKGKLVIKDEKQIKWRDAYSSIECNKLSDTWASTLLVVNAINASKK